MSAHDGALAGLRRTATAVFARIEVLEEHWCSGTLDVSELEDLSRAVSLLRVDVELHGPAADRSDAAVLATIREGIDAAVAIVVGLIERPPPPQRAARVIGSPSAGNGPVP